MNRLITGGTGFIGSHISGTLRASSETLNLLDFPGTLEFFQTNEISSVVHCAANISSAQKMKENHHTFLVKNLLIDLHVLEASRITKVQNLITLGSISGLLANADGYIDESCLTSGPASSVNYGYNTEKYFQPYILGAYQMDFKLNYKTILLSNCYGPGSVIEEDAPLVSSLVFRILRAKHQDINLDLYGTGEDLRNLTYVGDLDAIINQHLGNSGNVEPVIIASPYILKIRDIAEMIAGILNYDRKINFVDYSSNLRPVNKICRNDKLMKLGYRIEWTAPEQGLLQTLKDYT
jgi:GDP-L-fucose synthase